MAHRFSCLARWRRSVRRCEGRARGGLRRGWVRTEQGSEVIEYITLIPFIFGAALIGVQLLVAVSTIVTANSAAREGVRAVVVCDPQWETAVRNAAAGYTGSEIEIERQRASKGGTSWVRVRLRIPIFAIPGFGTEATGPLAGVGWASARATMRQERDCR
jgi:hypothetical protein